MSGKECCTRSCPASSALTISILEYVWGRWRQGKHSQAGSPCCRSVDTQVLTLTPAKPPLTSVLWLWENVFWVCLPCSGFVSGASSTVERHIWEFRANLWPSYVHLKKMWVELFLWAILFYFAFFRCGEVLNIHASPLCGFSHYSSGSNLFSPSVWLL